MQPRLACLEMEWFGMLNITQFEILKIPDRMEGSNVNTRVPLCLSGNCSVFPVTCCTPLGYIKSVKIPLRGVFSPATYLIDMLLQSKLVQRGKIYDN